jgi:hypothetical protein
MIKELLLSSILSFSISVRTPNDDTKPLDYEYSIKAEKNEGKFTYLDKESKDIYYTITNCGWQHESGFKVGLSFRQSDEYSILANLGYNKIFKQDDLEYIVGLSFKSNLDDNIINVKSEVKKWFNEKVNIFALYKQEYYNDKEDFQFKVGIGIKL